MVKPYSRLTDDTSVKRLLEQEEEARDGDGEKKHTTFSNQTSDFVETKSDFI